MNNRSRVEVNRREIRRHFLCPSLAARSAAAAVLLLACSAWAAASEAQSAPPVSYVVDLRAPATHLASVTMTIPEARPGTEIQFPAWTALYQIRDFVRNVHDVKAECDRKPIGLVRVDLHTWTSGAESCRALEIRYAVYLAEDSVFSSVLDENHAYLNLAMALFYLPRERERRVKVRYLYPQKWNLATFLDDPDGDGTFDAINYNELVDSPAEAGMFQHYDYEQNGARYRIIVHADAKAYDARRLVESVKKVTAAGTGLMQDVPFSRFTFLYHFPREGGGGLEHRDGTAITVARDVVKSNWLGLESITAHEFVHAWIVKRIRPQNLEPVDYLRGNDTSDLWLAEGVTSTLGEYILLRAGLISRKTFYARLAREINQLHDRSARKTQSVEDAGRKAWLEKYSDYQRPERSISYYNKGQVVGVLLDLAIRHASGNTRSLNDFFRRLNSDFAKRGRFFTRDDLLETLYDLAPSGCDFREFFSDYILGTRELDVDLYLGYAGLRVERSSGQEPSLGFAAVRNFDGPVTVQSVQAESNAARAGIESGDVLVEMNSKPLRTPPQRVRGELEAGKEAAFRVRRRDRELTIRFRVESAEGTSFKIEEDGKSSEAQRSLREHWLNGTTGEAQP